MKKLILLTPSAVPASTGRRTLEKYLYKNLETFSSGREFSDQLLGTAAALDKVAELDLGEASLIEMVVNPYNRVFLYYLSDGVHITDDNGNKLTFTESVKMVKDSDPSNEIYQKYFTNLSDPTLRDPSKIDYILRVETIARDLKTIPGLADRSDTQIFDFMDDAVVNGMYLDYYTDEVKAIVAEKLAMDFANYGYQTNNLT